MDAYLANQLWLAMTTIEAQEMLKAMKISDFPHMSQDDRHRFHRELHKEAYPHTREQKALSMEELKGFLSRGR